MSCVSVKLSKANGVLSAEDIQRKKVVNLTAIEQLELKVAKATRDLYQRVTSETKQAILQ